jgi:type IV pilus assembly protein PilE
MNTRLLLRNYRGARQRARGVTLIELMIVVVVIAILASIAIPSYRRYLIRAQRSEAKIALLQLQTAQEKFYLQNNAYTDKVTVSSTAPTPGLGLTGLTETSKYDIVVTTLGAGGQSYTATASPHAGGGQADDAECANFTINERGTRGNSGPKPPEFCWK